MKKSKTVNPKHETFETAWNKFSVSWKSSDLCRSLSLPLAANLGAKAPFIYFARYMNVTEYRTDYYIAGHSLAAPLTMRLMVHDFARTYSTTVRMTHFKPCEGSLAHALATRVVLNIYNKHLARRPEDESADSDDMLKAWTLLADVFHWSSNMLGIDYCDEAKLHLYSIDRIINIFQGSIRKGNKLTKLSEKLGNKRVNNN